MNLTDVINALVEEQGLAREKVISIVCEGVKAAYEKKFPQYDFKISFNLSSGEIEVFTIKIVSDPAKNKEKEISPKKAQIVSPKAKINQKIDVPFEGKIGRVEISTAKQVIALKIREIEQLATYEEFIDKKGTIVSGTIHKRERRGVAIKIDDVIGFLPTSNSIPNEILTPGNPIRVQVKEVYQIPVGGHQVILDRASSEFIKNLLEIEIPEIFEGIIEVKGIARNAGYKTKIIVSSHSKEIDPIGTCVGVRGSRIKPILKELGQEKIDLIEETGDKEKLIKQSLKPAEIDKVELSDNQRATVWLAEDQRSLAIGKMGQNISLAARLTGVEINLQELINEKKSTKSEEETNTVKEEPEENS